MKKPLSIALIQPDSPFLAEPRSFPNLGILYVSSSLKFGGYNPQIYDLTGGNKLPKSLSADIFGFSSQITQFRDVVSMKNSLREKNPNSLFVIGGPFVTHSPQEGIDEGFDVVVRGEGEEAMLKIADEFPNIKKGVYSSQNLVDPNKILPDWEGIVPQNYIYQLNGKRVINLMTKRGDCPYQCTFCAKLGSDRNNPIRFRSIDNVVDEVKYLKERQGFGAIALYDDEIFVGKKERDKGILEGLAHLDMPYRCMTRANLATKDDIKFLKSTGCVEICVGVETGDKHILEEIIRKGVTVEENTSFIRNCEEAGIKTKAYIIIGLPTESEKSVENTRNWLRKSRPDNFDVSVFTPYPGSEIYNKKDNFDIDWDEKVLREMWFSGKAQYEGCAVHTSELSADKIINLKKEIESEFSRKKGGSTSYWGPIKQ